jgi:HlyD family secretion protein
MRLSMNKKKLALLAAGLLTLGLLVWAAWPEAQRVETARLTQGDFVRELVEDAQTRVRERFAVTAPLAGQLVRPTLKAGDAVSAGQVVAEIWPAAPGLLDSRSQSEQRERIGAMEASLARAQANQARARAAEQQAQADLQRTESLARQGFVSPTQQESSRLTLQQRRQELTMASEELDTALHDLRRLRIGLSQPNASGVGPLGRVTAPVTGRVLKLHRDSEGPIAAGAPIMDLGDPAQQEIVTELLTEDAASLPTQAQALLDHWGGEGSRRARLARIESGAFTKVSALGVEEQRVRAVFEWQEAPPPGLGDGFKMEIRIAVQQAQGVPLAPVSAVFPHGQGHAVFAVESGRARLHAVELLGRNGMQAWLRTDLPPGLALIAYPPTRLRDGDRVKPIQP